MQAWIETFPEPLRLTLAFALFTLCVFGVIVQVRRMLAAGDVREELRPLMHAVRALRFVLVGLGALGMGLGWVLDAPVLVGLALVFGLEELYETVMIDAVLRYEERRRAEEEAGLA